MLVMITDTHGIELLPNSLPVALDEVQASVPPQDGVLVERDGVDSVKDIYRGARADRTLPQGDSRLRGLLNVVHVGFRTDEGVAKIIRYQNADSHNSLARAFGLRPGVNTFQFVADAAGGEFKTLPHLKHLRNKEIPWAKYQLENVTHDREPSGHPIVIWLLPEDFVDDIATEAGARVDAFEQDKSQANLDRMKKLTKSFDHATELDSISTDLDGVIKLCEANLLTILKTAPPYDGRIAVEDLVNEVYFGGQGSPEDDPGAIQRRAWHIHRQMYQNAIQLGSLAEHMRPDFDISSLYRTLRQTAKWLVAQRYPAQPRKRLTQSSDLNMSS